jgi:hypothetical protein
MFVTFSVQHINQSWADCIIEEILNCIDGEVRILPKSSLQTENETAYVGTVSSVVR